ncbi:hypothetical protein KGE16_002885, partial [Listeria monocytogenes]|nr:hypothetical protein [Listeria monocytogenes]EHM3395699.1 hypothetical protein [Listeria monocytogenes]
KKKQGLLQLAQLYEAHDDLKVEHAGGTYLLCEVCQEILMVSAMLSRLEAEMNGEVPRTVVKSKRSVDVTDYERVDAFMREFTVEQYVHFRNSGMTDRDIYMQLDIPRGLFLHWKFIHGIQDYPRKMYRVEDQQKQIHYYLAIDSIDLTYLLRGTGIQIIQVEEIAEDLWESMYIPVTETSAMTLAQLVDKGPRIGHISTLIPSLQHIESPQICRPKGIYEVLLYDGKNGNIVRSFVKKGTQILGGKKNKPIQIMQKGRPQTSISVGTYIVRAPNGDWTQYTKQQFFELYDLEEALIFTQEE